MALFQDSVSEYCSQLQKVSHSLIRTGDQMFNSTSIETCCSFCHNVCSPDFLSTCQSSSASSAVTSAHERPSQLEIWSYGLPSVFVVCSCAALGLCLYPIMKKKFFEHVLTWMVGLAIGCLSGIAIFQLMPQALEMPADSPAEIEQYLRKCLVIITALFGFYIAERVFKMVAGRRPEEDSPSSGIESRLSSEQEGDILQGTLMHGSVQFKSSTKSSETTDDSGGFEEKRHFNSADVIRRLSHEHVHFHGHDSAQPLKTIAWLILTGDSIHKFVDGLSIGAAFSASVVEGLTVSVAVFCEELPHELGDLAILLNSGLNLKQAVLYNIISGVTCFLGFGVGVFLGELPTARIWIFAVAAGMFFYISFANILPEMVAAVEDACQTSMKNGVIVLLLQVFGVACGICSMYFLATYADQIQLT